MRGLLSLLGFFFAVIMIVGVLYNNNYRLTRGDDQSSIGPSPAERPSDTYDDHTVVIDPNEQSSPAADPQWPEREVGRSSASRDDGGSGAASAADVRDWLSLQASAAVMEAPRLGVPAGVSLAVGVELLRRGRISMRDDLVSRVIEPLAKAKARADDRTRQRFKYVANSASWFAGLHDLGLYDEATLTQHFKRYNLAGYDAEVYLALQKGERAAPRQPSTVQASVFPNQRKEEEDRRPVTIQEVASEDLRGNMANAMNRYAERRRDESSEQRRVVPAAPRTEREVSSARHKAESLGVGESLTFKQPREYHAVLQEVLAVENGYESWEAYLAAEGAAARRQFADREDVMANGGRMIVKRQR